MDAQVKAITEDALAKILSVKSIAEESKRQHYRQTEAIPANELLDRTYNERLALFAQEHAKAKQENLDKADFKAKVENDAEFRTVIQTYQKMIAEEEGTPNV